jgi:transposase
MASGSTKQKRKVLTLEERVQAIKLIDAGKSAYKVAEDFGVGKTQIQSLRKRIYSEHFALRLPVWLFSIMKVG